MKIPNLARPLAALAVTLFSSTAMGGESTGWRLFVADQSEPVVHAINALDGSVVGKFPTKGPASLSLSESGRTVFAVQGDAGRIQIISSGIEVGDHGDHGDLEITEPKLLDVSFDGKKPAHFVDHHGQLALFFDGEGAVRVIAEADILAGNSTTREVKSPAPHHGVAVVVGEHVLITEPNAEKPDELPVGIRVIDAAGNAVGKLHECPDLHGEAASGELIAFACAKGLLTVKSTKDGAPSVEFLAYPEALPEGKTTTLRGGKGMQYFLGNWGPQKIALIDPTAAEPFRLIDLATRRVHFAVDPIRPKFAYVVTEDGKLHQIDVLAGKISASLQLTDPYSMDGHWSDPRPRIAVAGEHVVVTDPLNGKLHFIKAANFEKSHEVAVEGKPFNIVAVGGSGEAH